MILTLLTMRADLSPMLVNMRAVAAFQHSADAIADKLASNDGRRPVVFSTFWPENLSYGLTIGDMKFRMGPADAILNREFPPVDQVSFLIAPAKDPIIHTECMVADASDAAAVVMNYPCFKARIPELR